MASKPDNQGKRWSKEDITKISSMLENESTQEDIATELKRTTYSIQCQICIIASKMLDDKKPMDKVVDFTGLTQETIEKYIKSKDKKKEKEKSKKKKKKTDTSDSDSEDMDPADIKIISLLTEIRNLLRPKNHNKVEDD